MCCPNHIAVSDFPRKEADKKQPPLGQGKEGLARECNAQGKQNSQFQHSHLNVI
jgi:hypothetical protein